jgi:hypothetical protein
LVGLAKKTFSVIYRQKDSFLFSKQSIAIIYCEKTLWGKTKKLFGLRILFLYSHDIKQNFFYERKVYYFLMRFLGVLFVAVLVGNSASAQCTWYRDHDNDGFGTPGTDSINLSCVAPVGYVSNNTDCAPFQGNRWQLANFYIDSDGDGYTPSPVPASVCYGSNKSSCGVCEFNPI